MAGAAFLHGVEVIEINNGPVVIEVTRTAVIGLVGTAPVWSATGLSWSILANGAMPPRWNASWKVAAGVNQCIDSNGNLQQCSASGTTGAETEPTWGTTVGAVTASDGTASWKLIALAATLGIKNTPVLVNGSSQNSQFGLLVQGYTIPYALNAVQAPGTVPGSGGAQTIVVNVFDMVADVTAVSAAAMSFPGSGAQVLNLGHMGVSNVVVTNSGGSTTYVLGTDFTVDFVNGVITALSGGAITSGEAVKVSYNYADPTKIDSDAPIIGAITDGVYTGMQCFLTCWQKMGFWPKILIAPGFAQNADVVSAFATIAPSMRAVYLVDSPPLTQVSAAIANRGTVGNAFDSSDPRAILCFPNQLFTDNGLVPTGVTLSAAGLPLQTPFAGTSDSPLSQWVAGVMAWNDLANGYWWSPSNKALNGPLGPDVSMYMNEFDPNSDTNNLNAAGIVTVNTTYAGGLVVWGNRSAAYPTNTSPVNFISIRRTMDEVEEAIQISSQQFIDQPISNGLINSILASVNAFVRSEIAIGALVPGSAVTYNPALNPGATVVNGQLIFSIDCLPPPPLERLTYQTTIDPTLAANIGASTSASSQQAAA